MTLRPVTLQDWEALLRLRSWFDTAGSLQVEHERGTDASHVTIRRTPYPRTIRIDPEARAPEVSIEAFDDEVYVLADEGGGDVLGYVRALADPQRGVGWITHIVVQPHHRRNQVGYSLVQAVRRWADRLGLHHLQVELETRNLPAVLFFERCGFSLAGYNEDLQPDGRIVVFLSARLR